MTLPFALWKPCIIHELTTCISESGSVLYQFINANLSDRGGMRWMSENTYDNNMIKEGAESQLINQSSRKFLLRNRIVDDKLRDQKLSTVLWLAKAITILRNHD